MQTLSCGLLGTPLEEMQEWERFPVVIQNRERGNIPRFAFFSFKRKMLSAIPSYVCVFHISLFALNDQASNFKVNELCPHYIIWVLGGNYQYFYVSCIWEEQGGIQKYFSNINLKNAIQSEKMMDTIKSLYPHPAFHHYFYICVCCRVAKLSLQRSLWKQNYIENPEVSFLIFAHVRRHLWNYI